ncbi:MAG: cytochrome C [Candidatus Schekmanbacteria bacterium RBG_16_38_10]|uniref:Cytochrome C n=1 Tax=Candidatus Schekmanbacteria bacterium RBG_16_38_10 TaxID=1817879 RepID=A0A1F7RPK5_9BACT|nr:MAG: cytochrome C [Candidatus Schekmanbacteria bacterium RBG_16_38_10]
MKSHVWRPLWVAFGLVAVLLLARSFVVPSDFGVGERGFMYGYHRKSNEDEWKAFKVKYQTKEYCKDCHEERYKANMASKHKIIQCENCHSPAIEHPENPEKLIIDKSRALCIRCHAFLPYASSMRSKIKGINPSEHNPEDECSTCHDPHSPDL